MFLILNFLLNLTQSEVIPITVSYFGCTSTDQCERICRLGISNCDNPLQPQCEFGYFQFSLQNGWDCVLCPYAQYSDQFTQNCIDCIDNPTTWQYSRKCTQFYQIQSGDPTKGTYMQKNMKTPELFYIAKASSPVQILTYRDTVQNYEVYECIGCESFCEDDLDENCHIFEQSTDLVNKGVTCKDQYYFANDICQLCSFTNCKSCNSDTCEECLDGYALNADSQCTKCFEGCLSCFQEDTTQYCSQCVRTVYKDFKIYSLDFTQCVTCDNSCARCEFMSTDSSLDVIYPNREIGYIDSTDYSKYIKKCRQCSFGGYILSYDGESCNKCTIEKCELCYYSWDSTNSLLLDFTPKKTATATQFCFQCASGYKVNSDQKSCVAYTDTNCVSADKDGKCLRCKPISTTATSEYVLGLLSTTTIQCIPTQKCIDKLKHCQSCIAFLSDSKPVFNCIRCDDGYYPDIISGLCIECQTNCKKCWQYTESYNITEYMLYQTPGRQPDQFKLDYSKILEETIYEPFCTQCNTGFDLYDNKCLGCTDDCTILSNPTTKEIANACEFLDEFAYCSQCFNPYTERSLSEDSSHCIECPKYCLACHSRSQEQISKVNNYFNPSSTDLEAYSHMCYKLQNYQNTQIIYLDSTLGVPISCLTTPGDPITDPIIQNKKCRKSINYDITIGCNDDEDTTYQLSSYYKKKGNSAKITFQKLESSANYLSWSQQTIQEIILTIKFISQTENDGYYVCDFQRATEIATDLQKNIFTLQTLRIKLIGVGGEDGKSRVLFALSSYLTFSNYASVEIENIDIYNTKAKEYGLKILGDRTEFKISNSIIYKNPTLSLTTILSFILQNCISITIQSVTFDMKDGIIKNPIINLQQSTTFSNKKVIFNNLILTNVLFQNTFFYQPNLMAISTDIIITQLTITQTTFQNSSFFQETSNHQLYNLTTNQLIIKQCKFIKSNFMQSSFGQQIIFQTIEIAATQLTQSILFQLPTINIDRLFVYKTQINTNSTLIKTISSIQMKNQSSFIKQYSLSNFHFQNIDCQSINCLIYIETPSNDYKIFTNISFTNINLENVVISQLTTDQLYSVQSSIIFIYQVANVTLNNIRITDTIGITIFYFSQIEQFYLYDILYDWLQETFVVKPAKPPSDDDEIATGDRRLLQQVDKVVNPINNLIPISSDCANRKLSANSYSYFLLYITEFKKKVKIERVDVRRQLFMNSAAMFINSYDILQQIAQEVIELNYIQLTYNNLITSVSGAEMSLIQIKSSQQQNITVTFSQFSSNHLHQLIETQTADTPVCFLIQSVYANLTFDNIQFTYNRATKSTNGLNYIQVKTFLIKYSKFQYTNAMDVAWLSRLEEQQMSNSDQTNNLKSYFEVISRGANINAHVTSFDIQHTLVSESYGLDGAGFYISIINGYLNISQSSFQNILGFLEPKYSTKGGCLYIDSESAQFQFEVSNTEFKNCTVRASGGCIYLRPTKFFQNLTIRNSEFIQCQSLQRTIIDSEFLESSEYPILIMDNVKIKNNNYEQFIENLPNFQTSEYLQLLDSATLYYQNTGIMIIHNCLFTDIKFINLLKGVGLNQIVIDGSTFSNNIIYYQPLIELSFSTKGSSAQITNSGFTNNTSKIVNFDRNLSCILDPRTAFSYNVADQNCDVVTENMQLFSDVSSYYSTEITDAGNVASYNDMSESVKYNFPIKSSYYDIDELQFIQFYYPQFRWDYGVCILKKIEVYLITSQQQKNSALISVKQLNQNNQFQIDKLIVTNNYCLSCYGGLIQVSQITASISSSTFLTINAITCAQNIIEYYGCLTMTSQSKLEDINPSTSITDEPVSNSRFRLLQQEIQYSILVMNSRFSKNNARVGTSLTIIGLNAMVQSTVFVDNKASLIGGAIYFWNLENQNLYVANLTLQANEAQIGGAFYLNDTILSNINKLDINLEDNQAQASGNIAEQTYKQTIQLVQGQYLDTQTFRGANGDLDNDGVIDNIHELIKDNISLPFSQPGNYPKQTNLLILPSGQSINSYKYFYEYTQEYVPYNYVFRVINLNRFEEPVISGNSEDFCTVKARVQNQTYYDDTLTFYENYTNPNKGYYDSEKEGYDFDELSISFDPQTSEDLYLELQFTCNSVQIPVYSTSPPYNILDYNSHYNLYAHVRTFPCQKGEAYQSGKCLPCEYRSNQYSVTINAKYCSQYNADIMEQVGQASIKLNPGYWRPNYDNNNPQPCENLQANCLGGWVPGDSSCYTGHIGGLCESCDLYGTTNDESYTTTGPYKCGGCKPTEQLNMIVLIATSFVSFISMVLAVKGSYEASQLFIIEEVFLLMGVLLKSSASDLATLMKVLTNYFQIIQFIGTFQIEIPKSITQTANTAGNPTQSTTTSMDCLFITFSDINVLYFRMVWALLQPAMYLIGFYIIYLLSVAFKALPFKLNIITTAVIYQFLLLQPTYVDGFIVLASSRTISGLSYIQRDVAYRYDSESHGIWMIKFIGPMLFFWALFLPLLLMFMLWRNRKTLNQKFTRLIYGFFYGEYEINSYLWEFIKIFQKEFMVIILAYYQEQVIIKGLLLVLVMFLYGSYQISVSPYKNNRLNNLDRYSTVILSISLCLGILMKGTQDNNFWYLFYIIAAILILINIPFLLTIVYYIFEGYLIKFGPMLDKVKDKVDEKYPDLKKRSPFIRKLLINQEKMAIRVKQLWGIVRENVNDTNQICKENKKIKFIEAFPPYIYVEAQYAQLNSLIHEMNNNNNNNNNNNLEKEVTEHNNFPKQDTNNSSIIRQSKYQDSGILQEGLFIDELIEGKGEEKWPDNTEYKGFYINGKKQGHGTLIWPIKEGGIQQEQYVGHFHNDMFDGYGVYQWPDGRIYEGEWKEGKRHGYGVYKSEGKVYQGQFQNDEMNGEGILILGDKSLKGTWINGKLDGIVGIKHNNKTKQAIWENGKFIKWLQ